MKIACKFLRCHGLRGCAARICEQHGNGSGKFYTQYDEIRIAFDVHKCKEKECGVVFCDQHSRLIGQCRPCCNTFRATELSVGEDFLPCSPLVCRRHGQKCQKKLNPHDADGEFSDEEGPVSAQSVEGWT